MISAEEEVPSEAATTGNRQSKQIYFVPQLTPASGYPAKYFSSSPYDLPLMMPKQTPFIRRPIQQQQQLEGSNWPYTYPVLSSPGNQPIPIDLSRSIECNKSIINNRKSTIS